MARGHTSFFSILLCALVLSSLAIASAQRASRATPTATLEVSTVTGALTTSEVEDLPSRTATALTRCATHRTSGSASDTTRIDLEVDARGRVTEATVIGAGGTMRDEQRTRWLGCASEALRHATFPRHDAPSTVSVRLTWSDGTSSGLSGRRGSLFDHAIETRRPTVADTAPSYSRDTVRDVAGTHTAEVRHCYENELPQHPGMEGTILLAFTIQADGTVTNVVAREDQPNVAALTACVIASVQRWTFPLPEGGMAAEVTYPFVFRQAERPH